MHYSFKKAFAAGIAKVYESAEELDPDAADAVGSFGRCLRTLFWALFGTVSLCYFKNEQPARVHAHFSSARP